jgi:hypothetical protein
MLLLIENFAEGKKSFPAAIVLVDSLNVSKNDNDVSRKVEIEMTRDSAPK